MWKFQVGMAVLFASVGLILWALSEPSYGHFGMRDAGQTMAGLGSVMAVWITIKRFVFGIDGD